MTPFLQLAFSLAVILFLAKLAGYLSSRIGQPAVLGELLMGVFLGPSLIDLTHLPFITDTHLTEIVYELGELGVLLLMFLAGLELHLSDLTRNSKVSAFAGVLGVVLPVGLGWGLGLLIGLQPNNAIFLGLTLGATSVSISAQTLMELRVLRSRVGLGLLGAAVFDDILVILLLSTFLALTSGAGGALEILLVIARMAAFLVLSIGFGLFWLPKLTHMIGSLPISQGALSFSIVILLVYGFSAELIGEMAAITGAFVAGLMFGRTNERETIETGMRSIAYGFFVPVFFISIGLTINVQELSVESLWIIFVICIIAILGKIIGSGFGAKLAGFSNLEALQMGIGMVSRGEVGLIVAQVGVSANLIDNSILSSIIAMVLVTTLVTPPLLRASFHRSNKQNFDRPAPSIKE